MWRTHNKGLPSYCRYKNRVEAYLGSITWRNGESIHVLWRHVFRGRSCKGSRFQARVGRRDYSRTSVSWSTAKPWRWWVQGTTSLWECRGRFHRCCWRCNGRFSWWRSLWVAWKDSREGSWCLGRKPLGGMVNHQVPQLLPSIGTTNYRRKDRQSSWRVGPFPGRWVPSRFFSAP